MKQSNTKETPREIREAYSTVYNLASDKPESQSPQNEGIFNSLSRLGLPLLSLDT